MLSSRLTVFAVAGLLVAAGCNDTTAPNLPPNSRPSIPLKPEIIVISGGVVNGWDLFAPDMYQEVSERAFRVTAQEVKIARAECGDNAGLLGAARLAFDEMGR